MLSLLLVSGLVWLAVVHWQTQQALRWWFEQRQRWLCREAEQVRNGLLQETFVMRRRLELSLDEDGVQHWIEQMKYLDGHLVQLSDNLAPPYGEVSLPLAIRDWAKRFEAIATPGAQQVIALTLPDFWHSEPLIRSQILLTALDQLLHLVATQNNADAEMPISIELRNRQHWGELVVQIHYASVEAAQQAGRSPELKYLPRTFQVLASGRCSYRQQQQTVSWCFRWQYAHDKV
ncbi:hypothetical protein H6F95_03950 [Cyanobacteria bacterium FACHB-471]|nr:hypothetical protein [Cyanobacteria bacterium FACHB-471]